MVRDCVYFITDGDFIKIGIASDLDRRVRQLQTGNPRLLTVMAVIKCRSMDEARDLETFLHRSLSDLNILNEWFVFDRGAIMAAVARAGYHMDFLSPIPENLRVEHRRYVFMNFVKELIEILGALVLGAFLILGDIPILSDCISFAASNPFIRGLAIGGMVVVVLFDIIRRRRPM